MSKRQLKADDEEGFLRAYKDEVLDIASDHNVVIECRLLLPVTSGGLVIRMYALGELETGATVVMSTFDQPYPTHSATRLHAALYRAAVRLGIELREERRRRAQGDGQTTD